MEETLYINLRAGLNSKPNLIPVTEQIDKFISNRNKDYYVSLYKYNGSFIDSYLANASMTNGVQSYMLNNKAESAFRLLCLFTDENPDTNLEKFKLPPYIEEAIQWITG